MKNRAGSQTIGNLADQCAFKNESENVLIVNIKVIREDKSVVYILCNLENRRRFLLQGLSRK
jgi:hypothetical protein